MAVEGQRDLVACPVLCSEEAVEPRFEAVAAEHQDPCSYPPCTAKNVERLP